MQRSAVGTLKFDDSPNRVGIFLPSDGTKEKPNKIILTQAGSTKIDRAEKDYLVRSAAQKLGLNDKETELLAEETERRFEQKMKTKEASLELRRHLAERQRYPKLKNGGIKPPKKRNHYI
jgi:hypothetical protein|tara:strand:+ start:267 stop:626 length:360 start_codon:yes stop_codon:yes gene_type:complete